jgi:aerobic-type carbon monoxide dehydrogenase small subunit (CoxS/CutS family)
MQHGALQCGFCTPGMILQGYGLLLKNNSPSRAQIVEQMNLHLCRCGTYTRIVEAMQTAAAELRGGKRL